MIRDFTNIEYLKYGNKEQQQAYIELTKLSIFEDLQAYSPILTGTIPIGINIPGSDLDIICECSNHQKFAETLTYLYSDKDKFEIRTNTRANLLSTIASFQVGGFEIEVFGQNCPTKKQNAYRHMLVEHKILNLKGGTFRREIIRLKQEGFKTEPAFAKLLALAGDPYVELLKLKV
ncbi:DUF4269 domain-containing protein [Aestuariibaculum sediminum]|uniref:DUF4269 domain-containing protein n=1 Tax=Aestuariibaculum sediminum TaxID=2770637 RepID=A0A8J6QH01_9FLAO|nr:DUF4269 domain-containing protein [Aestuariibaculum sediminum]MBD0831594.1 DUF4269 domain-containing protein [Aestuariibaculum sediminum]